MSEAQRIQPLLDELIACAGVFDVSTDYEADKADLEKATRAVLDYVQALRDECKRLREAHATDVANSLVPFQVGDWIRFKWFKGEADGVVTGYKQGTLLFRSEEAGEGFMELQNITGHISKQYRATLTPAAGKPEYRADCAYCTDPDYGHPGHTHAIGGTRHG